MKRSISGPTSGQLKTSEISRNFLESTASVSPSQTIPATSRGPSGTRTIDPGWTFMPGGTI
ncbi:predicted protein [Brucella sp. NVSL 07-0026]|nr:predicted protein [Brucella sp. NVSL 07-0026]